jgi:tripartite-type tricarboxylate transporter receptor subunit TctC
MSKLIAALMTAIAFCAVALTGAPAWAQAYPTKTVKMIIGFAAGGPTDVIGRILAQDMSATLGQPVIVENRTGANALIATEAVARSAPDGYTLLFASLSHNVNAILSPEAKYHPIKDFAPISNAANLPMVVVTEGKSQFNTVKDLVAYAKSNPEAVIYGSAGNGGSAHLAAAMLETASGTKMTHVPFRGNAPALTEVMAGRVTFMFYPIIGVAERVAQNQLKPLAVGTEKRHPDFPNVPTLAEQGFNGFEETAPWVGLLAPAGTPEAIVNKLHAAMTQSLAKPETKERLKQLGAVTIGDTPAQFRAYLEKDAERWARVIRASGVKASQ